MDACAALQTLHGALKLATIILLSPMQLLLLLLALLLSHLVIRACKKSLLEKDPDMSTPEHCWARLRYLATLRLFSLVKCTKTSASSSTKTPSGCQGNESRVSDLRHGTAPPFRVIVLEKHRHTSDHKTSRSQPRITKESRNRAKSLMDSSECCSLSFTVNLIRHPLYFPSNPGNLQVVNNLTTAAQVSSTPQIRAQRRLEFQRRGY